MRGVVASLVACALAGCAAAATPRVEPRSTDDDQDGVVGDDDRCPGDPEDADGFRDADGCPDRDDDADAIADADDLCRCVAEDADGFEDEDGCPDPDDDGDRIPDACDACPREPEAWNGCADDDGCPDRAHIVISESRIVILERITFAPDSFDIPERTIPILDAIAATLVGNPQITRIRLIGHADFSERRADRLGQKRAEAVRDYLVAHGVDPARLEVASAGDTQPIVPRASVPLRWQNRRVSFEITEIDGEAVTAGSPLPDVAPPPPSSCSTGWRSPCLDRPPPAPVDVCAAERTSE